MVIILVQLKKKFSTDAIIEKTKAQMNRVIIDVNNHANRDIELINDCTKRTRALLNDADKKMESFRQATQILRDTIAEAEKVGASGKKKVVVHEERLPDIPPVGKKTTNNPYIDPNAAYQVRNFTNNEMQGSLFDNEVEDSILKDETKITPEGAAYKEVPLIITKIYDDNPTQKSNKSLSEKVEKLFREGMKVEDIATELSCPTSEVEFIIDML